MKTLIGLFTLLLATFTPGEAHGSDIAAGWHDNSSLFAEVSEKTGMDIKVLATIGALESSFRSKIKAKTSSATGLFQFTNRTWRVTLKSYGEQYGLDKTADRKDPVANALMGAEYLKENTRVLKRKLGRVPSLTELYMSHVIAPRRVAALDDINPKVSVALLYPRLARSNIPLFYNKSGKARTVSEFKQYLTNKVNRAYYTYNHVADTALTTFLVDKARREWEVASATFDEVWLCHSNPAVRAWAGRLDKVIDFTLTINTGTTVKLFTLPQLRTSAPTPEPTDEPKTVQMYADRRRLA